MNQQQAERLAASIARSNPALFDALAAKAGLTAPGMSGFLDTIRSIGSSVGTAVKSVGSFLTSQQGLQTLAELGGTYAATQQQRSLLQMQIEAAQSAAALPMPTGVHVNPALPVASFMAQYGPWLLLGGGLLLGILLLTRRR